VINTITALHLPQCGVIFNPTDYSPLNPSLPASLHRTVLNAINTNLGLIRPGQ